MTRRSGISLPPMLDDLDVGITVHDPATGSIIGVNEKLERLYGYSAAELREMDIEEYTAPSTRYTQSEAVKRIQAAADGDPQEFEWQVERADGELLWVSVRLSQTTIDGRECVVAEINDVTTYRNRDRRHRLLSRIIRHNLRNKMTVVMCHGDRLKSELDDEGLEDEVGRILDVAEDVGRLSRSVHQIEQMAKPDRSDRSRSNIADLVRSVAEDARREHPDAEVFVESPPEVWAVADEGLQYAVEHAVENAIEHNDAANPTVEIDVEPRTNPTVRIADSGPSIPEVETGALDATAETSSTYHGTGVGLWVMQWCVDSLGGELSFERNDPRGNVIVIELPSSSNTGEIRRRASEEVVESAE
ncbi:PAS domain-containing sensor histidine kinase [Haloarculaceae archaeon H-GB1-1]|nr:PAS domain-containing sensor histidine kinase [Haloarculaceae archaeon H-GB1-1]